MGACLGSCAGAFTASALCSVGPKSKTSRTPYVIFIVVNVIVALVLNRYGDGITIPGIDVEICNDNCRGNAAVFRVSFAMACFFFLHAIFCYCFIDCHYVCWPAKLIAYLAGLIGCFFIDQEVFVGYAQLARVVSILFLLVQIVLLIDFAYRWNEAWVTEDVELYEGMTPKQKGLLAISVLFYMVSITSWGLMYHYWNFGGPNVDCGRNLAFISVTLVVAVIYTGISISAWCDHGALLPSAVVTLYCSYLLYSSLSSDPSDCNATDPANRSEAELWIGLVIAACSIGYAGYNVSSQTERLFGGQGEKEEEPNASSPMLGSNRKLSENEGDDLESGKKKKEQDVDPPSGAATDAAQGDVAEDEEIPEEAVPALRKANSIFHLVMFAASCYMAMLLANWGVYTDNEDSLSNVDVSVQSLYVKIASQWATMVLYIWTLVGPGLCPGREFGY